MTLSTPTANSLTHARYLSTYCVPDSALSRTPKEEGNACE